MIARTTGRGRHHGAGLDGALAQNDAFAPRGIAPGLKVPAGRRPEASSRSQFSVLVRMKYHRLFERERGLQKFEPAEEASVGRGPFEPAGLRSRSRDVAGQSRID